MNTTKTILLLLLLQNCESNLEFNIPLSDYTQPEIEGHIIDIGAVIGLYNQNEEPYTFETNDFYMEGYVISNDAAGNFFKQLIIQDKAENPLAGIAIEIDVNSYYTKYPFGSKVFIKLDGLTVGIDNGIMKLGRADLNSIGRIAASKIDSVIIRTGLIETIKPKSINMTQFSDEIENLYIELQDVQFNKFEVLEENPKTFASEDTDQFNGERLLESCSVNKSVILSTSTFADFKSLRLPQGRGGLKGILTRDFFDEFYTIYLNTPEDISFENSNRCDIETIPIDFIRCEYIDGDYDIVFYDNFNAYSNLASMESAGWINKNLTGDGIRYSLGSFDGNKYAQISGFNTEDYRIDSWLITPSIDLQTGSDRSLFFDIQSSYSTGRHLTVLITNNFVSTILDADWFLLSDISYPVGPSSGFGNIITTLPSAFSCIDGSKIRLAFRYQGSDPIATTRYHIDNVTVLEKSH